MGKSLIGLFLRYGVLIACILPHKSYANAVVYSFSRGPRFSLHVDPQNPLTATPFERALYSRRELQRESRSDWAREQFLSSMQVTEEQIAAVKPIFRIVLTAPDDVVQSVSDEEIATLIGTFHIEPEEWLTAADAKLLPMVSRLWQIDPDYYSPPNYPANTWAKLFAQLESQISQSSIELEWLVPVRFSLQPQLNRALVESTRTVLTPSNPKFFEKVQKYMALLPRLDRDRQAQLANIIDEQIANVYAKRKSQLPFDPMFLPIGQTLIEFYLNHSSSEKRSDFLLMVMSQAKYELSYSDRKTVREFADWLVKVAEPILKINPQFGRSVARSLLDIQKNESPRELLARLHLYEPLRTTLDGSPKGESALYGAYIEAWSEQPIAYTRSMTRQILRTYFENSNSHKNTDAAVAWIAKILGESPLSEEGENLKYSNVLTFLLDYAMSHENLESRQHTLINLVRTYTRGSWFGELPEFEATLLRHIPENFSASRDEVEIESVFDAIIVRTPEGPKALIRLTKSLTAFFQGLKLIAGENAKVNRSFEQAYVRNATRTLKAVMRKIDLFSADLSLESAMGLTSTELLLDVLKTLPADRRQSFLQNIAMAGSTWVNADGFIATMNYRRKERQNVNQLYETLYEQLTPTRRPRLRLVPARDCQGLLEGPPAGTVSQQN